MKNNNIILYAITPHELKELLQEMIREEFTEVNEEVQRVIDEDDLVSMGTACRLLGVCSKVPFFLVKEGHFTVFYHMKEKRYVQAKLLEFRNKCRVNCTRTSGF